MSGEQSFPLHRDGRVLAKITTNVRRMINMSCHYSGDFSSRRIGGPGNHGDEVILDYHCAQHRQVALDLPARRGPTRCQRPRTPAAGWCPAGSEPRAQAEAMVVLSVGVMVKLGIKTASGRRAVRCVAYQDERAGPRCCPAGSIRPRAGPQSRGRYRRSPGPSRRQRSIQQVVSELVVQPRAPGQQRGGDPLAAVSGIDTMTTCARSPGKTSWTTSPACTATSGTRQSPRCGRCSPGRRGPA